ncbi:hypothetical protein BDR07DRAFT_409463 [Suillus spraguei]|nr:hypothetical protein BDR07DRAFT_409463 [Suillus spraguei]
MRRAIHVQLENAPLHLINTSTGRLCNRDEQINIFTGEYRVQRAFTFIPHVCPPKKNRAHRRSDREVLRLGHVVP